MSNSPIFIVSLHRTGSTLLRNIIDNSLDVSMATDEMHLSTPWHKDYFDNVKRYRNLDNEENLKIFVDYLFSEKLVGTFWKDLPQTLVNPSKVYDKIRTSSRSHRDIITILLKEHALQNKKRRFGAKYPLHHSRIDLLYKWYPKCKVIHLTRDPRAICASALYGRGAKMRLEKYPWLTSVVHYSTLWFFLVDYIWSSYTHKKYSSKDNYLLVRYEDLVTSPTLTIKKICDFTNIEYVDPMFEVYGKYSSHHSSNSKGFHSDYTYKWKNILNEFDSNWLTFFSKKSRDDLGYKNIDEEYKVWSQIAN